VNGFEYRPFHSEGTIVRGRIEKTTTKPQFAFTWQPMQGGGVQLVGGGPQLALTWWAIRPGGEGPAHSVLGLLGFRVLFRV
jgi:hypothetical protein